MSTLIESMSEGEPAGELTTAQVADYLGVRVQTVYAYVSRGVLRPARKEPGTGSVFRMADVQGLIAGGRGRRRRPATSEDVRTSITRITAGTLQYRGRDVTKLAGSAGFEQVRALLTGQPEPGEPVGLSPGERDALAGILDALPAGTRTLDRFKHAVLLAATTDPGRHDRTPPMAAVAGRRAAAFMVGTLPGAPEEALPMAAALARALEPCPRDVLDLALALLADHDLAVSTTAVRVAISSGADVYSAMLAGLAAADSPHHVGASVRAVEWVAGALRDPQAALDHALAAGPPPGFGHGVYTERDPRAQLLLERIGDELDAGRAAALRWLEGELMDRRGWVLNVDAALAVLVDVHGLRAEAGAVVFACARTAGWTAHAIEELGERAMRFRLRGVYDGRRS